MSVWQNSNLAKRLIFVSTVVYENKNEGILSSAIPELLFANFDRASAGNITTCDVLVWQ